MLLCCDLDFVSKRVSESADMLGRNPQNVQTKHPKPFTAIAITGKLGNNWRVLLTDREESEGLGSPRQVRRQDDLYRGMEVSE